MKLVGFIKEHNCIKEAVGLNELISNTNESYEKIEKVVKYLNSGAILLAWMGYFIDAKTKKLIAPDSYFTDGIWIWPSYFTYYLGVYPSMKISPDFLTYLENKKFEFTLVDNFESQKHQLESEFLQKLNEDSQQC